MDEHRKGWPNSTDMYAIGPILRGKAIDDSQLDRLKSLEGRGKREPVTLEWYPSDTKERFESAPEDFKDYWNSKKHIMDYKLNSYGMRCEEIEADRESIVFLGCSMTFGVGCPKTHTWGYKTAQHFGLREVNLGLPAGSLDSAFRLYYHWQPFVKAKMTVLAVPPGYRMESVCDDRANPLQSLGIWQQEWQQDKQEIENRLKILNDPNIYLNYNKNILAIKKIAEDTDSQFFMIPWTSPEWTITNGMRQARDRAHPDEQWHKEVAEKLINVLQDKL